MTDGPDNVVPMRPLDQLARELDEAPEWGAGPGDDPGPDPADPGPEADDDQSAGDDKLPPKRRDGDRPWGEIWEGCPVTPLGVRGLLQCLIDVHGQLHEINKLDIQTIGKLFGHRQQLLWARYPVKVRGSKKPAPQQFSATRASADIMAACAEKGLFDPMGTVRGTGAWTDATGNLVYHCGDVVLTHEGEKPPGALGRAIYPAQAPIPHPAVAVNIAAVGKLVDALRAELSTWQWRRKDLDVQIAIGMMCCMVLGGALDWRPAFWLTGGKSTGKSRLQRLIELMMGGEKGLLRAENATAASISNYLRQSTLPVALDELEPGDNGSPKEKSIVELMRIASSGGRRIRSNPDQTVTETVIRSTFIASSILIPGVLKAQDRSRFIVLDLDPFPAGHKAPLPLRTADWLPRGLALKRLLIDRWPAWAERLDRWRFALAAKGVDGRNGDNWATVLAMADLVEHADGMSDEAVQMWAARVSGAIRHDLTDIGSDADDVLTHLLTQTIDPMRRGQAHTIAAWLKVAAERPGAAKRMFGADATYDEAERARSANKMLAAYGLRVIGPVEQPVLFVATKQMDGLKRLFDKSDWQGGAWTQSLQRIAGAKASSASRYLEGIQTRGSEVPFASIPGLMALDSEDGGSVPASGVSGPVIMHPEDLA